MLQGDRGRRLKRINFRTVRQRVNSVDSHSGSLLQALTLLLSLVAAIAAIAQAYFAQVSRYDAFEEIRVARRVEECAKLVSALRSYKRELQLVERQAVDLSGIPISGQAMNQLLRRSVTTLDEIVESTTRLQMLVSVENIAKLESALDTMKDYVGRVSHIAIGKPRTDTNFANLDRDIMMVTGVCRDFAAVFASSAK